MDKSNVERFFTARNPGPWLNKSVCPTPCNTTGAWWSKPSCNNSFLQSSKTWTCAECTQRNWHHPKCANQMGKGWKNVRGESPLIKSANLDVNDPETNIRQRKQSLTGNQPLQKSTHHLTMTPVQQDSRPPIKQHRQWTKNVHVKKQPTCHTIKKKAKASTAHDMHPEECESIGSVTNSSHHWFMKHQWQPKSMKCQMQTEKC